jgi:hypothetical protein
LLELGVIGIEDYLTITNLPFNDELLEIVERRKAQELAMQQQLAANPANQQQVDAAQQMLRPAA